MAEDAFGTEVPRLAPGTTDGASRWLGPTTSWRPLDRQHRKPAVRPALALGALGALLAGLVVSLLRQPGVPPLDSIWAEDGSIFLQQAVRNSTLDAFRTHYAGYLHLAPRLVAQVAAVLPLSDAAATFALGAALLAAASGLVVYRATEGHLASRPLRGTLAVAVVVVPIAQGEVLNNVANAQWYLVFAAFWALLWRPRSRWETAASAIVVVLASLSEPLVVLFLPVVVFRIVDRRDLQDLVPIGAYAVATAIQLFAVATDLGTRRFEHASEPVKLVGWYVYRVVGYSVLGDRLLGEPHGAWKWGLVLAAGAAVLVLLVAASRLPSSRVGLVLLLLATSFVFYFVSTYLTGVAAPRYSLVPAFLLYSAVAVAVDDVLRHDRGARWRPLVAGLGVVLAVVWVTNLRVPNERSHGPRWSRSLAQARVDCRTTDQGLVRLPVTPPNGRWFVTLPCSRVTAADREPAAPATVGTDQGSTRRPSGHVLSAQTLPYWFTTPSPG